MERTIRVTGKGKVSVKPDMIQLGIEAGGLYSEYYEAVKKSAKETTLIRNAIATAGMDPKGLKTDRFSVNTEYENYQDRNNNWKRRFAGYKYEHAMHILFPNDNKILGKVLYALSVCPAKVEFSIRYSRKLRRLGIGILFEKENINTMEAGGELLFTILSSLAQEESRNISENCKWGIRHNYRQGIVHLNTTILLGYEKDKEGNITIDRNQAAIVKRIFREFEEGWTPAEISKRLKKDKIKGVHGKSVWSASTISSMLANEKYKGDARLQKTVTVDYLTKKRVKNEGQVEQYYVTGSHKAIIPKEEWEAVQLERARRRAYCEEVGLKNYGRVTTDSAFISKVVCGKCGTAYMKKSWNSRDIFIWCCRYRWKGNGSICQGDNVKETTLQRVMVIAWNSVVRRIS